MKSVQEFILGVSNFFVGRREDAKDPTHQRSDPQTRLKKLDSDDAFRNPDGSPGSTPSSNTEYVDKPAIVNKLESGKMKLTLAPPKE